MDFINGRTFLTDLQYLLNISCMFTLCMCIIMHVEEDGWFWATLLETLMAMSYVSGGILWIRSHNTHKKSECIFLVVNTQSGAAVARTKRCYIINSLAVLTR